MKRTLVLGGLTWLVIVALAIRPATAQSGALATAQGPVAGALATLAAATAQAEQARAAYQATARAQSIQATSQAQKARATAQAQSAAATQSAIDDLNRQRAAAATRQAVSIEATAQAVSIEATAQAGQVSSQATASAVALDRDRQLAQTYAQREERFSLGLLGVEIATAIGALWVLWRLARTLTAWADKMRPQTEPTLAGVIATPGGSEPVVIDMQPEPAQPERMPDFVQVVNDPRMVEAIKRWAERYDAARE